MSLKLIFIIITKLSAGEVVNLNLMFPNCSSVIDARFLVEIREFSVGLTFFGLILGAFLKRLAECLLFCLLL